MHFRKYILIIGLMLTSFSGIAQAKKVALGLGFSPTINWFGGAAGGVESNGNRIGFNYGLIADLNFGENYAFSTGLFINHGGGKVKSEYNIDSLKYSVENEIKIQSVRIPLTLRMMTKEIGWFRYYGKFGFNLDYTYDATALVRVNGGSESEEDIRADISPFNLSLSLGAGMLYNISGTTNLVIGVSYNNGLFDVLEGKSGSGDDIKATADQFALNLGVLF